MPEFQNTKLDAEALHTFVTVAQLRSFSAAAEVLHKTTSAISYRIKALEDSVGTPLFLRTTRSVTLTPSGEVLLEKASQFFEWLQMLPEELKQVSDGIEPHFTLVVNNLLYDAAAITALLAHLVERFPHAAFEVRRAVYMGVWDEMINNGGQMALGVPGFHTINDDFATEPLGVVNWVFVVAPGHPLASAPEPLSNDMLRRYPAVNVQDTSHRLSKRTAWRLSGQKEFLVPDLDAKIACHTQGLAIGFLPRPMARGLTQLQQLVERSVAAGRSPSPLALAWRRQGAGKIVLHLRELFVQRDALVLPLFAPIEESIT
ncbi:MAG: HTH-type transcriptional activator AllS [Proteobacteria bacterium]|nr:HTH-type transcriptional activator AllS [Pseudomonadota bacterium]